MTQIPTRLLVLQRLTALLRETTVLLPSGPVVLTDAVFRGRTLIGDESKPWPIISILEAPRPDFGVYAGSGEARKEQWQLLIQGMADDDMLNPSDSAYMLYAAVEEQLYKIAAISRSGSGKPLFPEHFMLGNLITDIEISAPVIRPPGDRPSATAFFFLPVRVGIATVFGSPYTTVS